MSVLKELINEFAIFSTPTPDEEQIAMGDGTENEDGSQDEVEFSVDKDGIDGGDAEHEDHDPETCSCPCHDHEDGEKDIESNPNIEVVDGEGDDEDGDGEFNLDDEDEDELGEDKFKLF